MNYRCVTTSIGGFIQQLAVCYVGRGYWFYVPGRIPRGKNPHEIDKKLIKKYAIDLSKYQRCRKKKSGSANLQYLRYENIFLLLATPGKHLFFTEEANNILDARRTPIKFYGYTVGYSDNHPRVRIEQERYKDLKAYFLDIATHRSTQRIEAELSKLPFEPYAQVKNQLFSLGRAINKKRATGSLNPISLDCIRAKRRIYQPFEPSPIP